MRRLQHRAVSEDSREIEARLKRASQRVAPMSRSLHANHPVTPYPHFPNSIWEHDT
jgi:hypothetical protein